MNIKLNPTNRQQLAQFIAFANQVASNKRESSGFSGSWNDGGASRLEENIKTWHAGLEGKIPESLKDIVTDFEHSIDPEYQKYLELKKKFE